MIDMKHIEFEAVPDVPVGYKPNWVNAADDVFNVLWNELDWVRHPLVPRREYYTNLRGVDYAYGSADFARTYKSQPLHWYIEVLLSNLMFATDIPFEAVFINGYEDGSDHLGWHSDNSPEMDDSRPIGIVSLGAEREIWFRQNPVVWQLRTTPITKVRLGHGSLCLMEPGMQDTHQHRIPKSDRVCGPRISLTFRGYVDGT